MSIAHSCSHRRICTTEATNASHTQAGQVVYLYNKSFTCAYLTMRHAFVEIGWSRSPRIPTYQNEVPLDALKVILKLIALHLWSINFACLFALTDVLGHALTTTFSIALVWHFWTSIVPLLFGDSLESWGNDTASISISSSSSSTSAADVHDEIRIGQIGYEVSCPSTASSPSIKQVPPISYTVG